MTISNILTNLNDKQSQVVTAPLTNLAVIAGAGTGKTGALVHRIAWLIETYRISAHSILAVTFTNKAAAEMRARVEQLLNFSLRGMWIGTFHGIAHRLLRTHWLQAGLTESFQILDADDQYRLIRRVINLLNLSEDKWSPRQAQWYINAKKDEGIRPHQILIGSHFDEIEVKIYQHYEDQCAKASLVDFAELLLRSYEMLFKNSELLQHYQQRFSQILVDEFQDTNTIQYLWIKLLAGNTANVMIVGDDDQSIYSWRGAQVENMQRFNQDFPADVIRLDQNYRSTKTILEAANAVIAHNSQRFGKNLWTTCKQGDEISLYEAFNEIDEAKFISSQIKKYQRENVNLSNMAVLYRSNAQSRIIEEELLSANIPYRIYGGLKFFERAEIKDTLAYLRLLANPNDDQAFERAVNMPPRGIGNTTVDALRDYSRQTGLSLWQATLNAMTNSHLNTRSRKALTVFLDLIKHFQSEISELPLYRQTEYIVHHSGLFEYYKKDRTDKTQSRLENLAELIQATREYTPDPSLPLSPLQDFLTHVALESGENQAEHYQDCVQLMTLHSAKGLEFAIVFLTGMEEGLFPHKMSVAQPGRLEEERRLCYVGMTRAKEKLFLTYSESRRINGTQCLHIKSRFINEIPNELLLEIRLRTKVNRPVSYSVTPMQHQIAGNAFQLGQRVRHKVFGEGVILNYEGQGAKAHIQVKFSKETKWLVAEYAQLEAF